MFDWHILVGMVGVSTAAILHPMIVGLTMGDNKSGARVGSGCFLMIVGGPLIQAIAVSAFVLFCLPAIIGGQGFTPTVAIGTLFWPVFKTGFLAMLMVLVLCFIPIVGRLIAETPGVPVFLQGIFMMKPISKKLYYAISDGTRLPDSAFPSFWSCLGYVVIGIALCWVGVICLTIITD